MEWNVCPKLFISAASAAVSLRLKDFFCLHMQPLTLSSSGILGV
jgi:hypothetical protein